MKLETIKSLINENKIGVSELEEIHKLLNRLLVIVKFYNNLSDNYYLIKKNLYDKIFLIYENLEIEHKKYETNDVNIKNFYIEIEEIEFNIDKYECLIDNADSKRTKYQNIASDISTDFFDVLFNRKKSQINKPSNNYKNGQ